MERGDITKIVIGVILLIFIVFLGVQIWHFQIRAAEARKNYEAAKVVRDERKGEEERLEAEYRYYQNPMNFLKELRARFNYHEPDEKTLILVPKATSSD